MKKWHFALSLVAVVAVAMAAGPVLAGPEEAPNGPLAELFERVGVLEDEFMELHEKVFVVQDAYIADLLERVSDLEVGMEEQRLPEGSILMWSGEVDADGHPLIEGTPDADWWLCNGANGTPDLTDRFVIGAGAIYSVGDTGGSEEQTLEVANLPEHSHEFSGTTDTADAHVHFGHRIDVSYQRYSQDFVTTSVWDGPNPVKSVSETAGPIHISPDAQTSFAGAHSHTVSGTTDSAGDGEKFDIIPPYYALAYIMYLPE